MMFPAGAEFVGGIRYAEVGFRCRRRGGWNGAEGVGDFVAEVDSEEEMLVLFLAEEKKERG